MRDLIHGEGGGAAYLSPGVLCCREQVRQSQTTCIILVAWVHAQESRIPSPSTNYSPVFLTFPNKSTFHSVLQFPWYLALSLLAVSDKRSGESNPALPDPPQNSESVEASVISVRACSFSKRELVCELVPPLMLLLNTRPSCGT